MVWNLYLGLAPDEEDRWAFSLGDERGNFIDAGRFAQDLPGELSRVIRQNAASGGRTFVALDGPRQLLPAPRHWDWDLSRERWIRRRRGLPAGRHAEIILRAHGFAECRWTGLAGQECAAEGQSVRLAASCGRWAGVQVREVCGAVTLAQLDPPDGPGATARRGPVIGLTAASLALATAREFQAGRGMEVGGGDGLGTILLARALPPTWPALWQWPGLRGGSGEKRGREDC